MSFELIEASRPGLAPLPETDSLFKLTNGSIVRLRVKAKTSDGDVRDLVPEPGTAEQINIKFQCSLCKDSTGDVRKDVAGNHLVLAAEVHSVTADALVRGKLSFDAWLAGCINDVLSHAESKQHIIDEVLARYRL